MAINRAVAVIFEDTPVARFWTGQKALVGPFSDGSYSEYLAATGDAQTFEAGGTLFSFGAVELTKDTPDRRAQIVISSVGSNIRSDWLQDSGPVRTEVFFLHEVAPANEGDTPTWQRVPNVGFVGVVSDVQIQGGNINIELETLRGDVDKGRPRQWSADDFENAIPPTGWLVDGAHDKDATAVKIKGGNFIIPMEAMIEIDGGDYRVAASTYTGLTLETGLLAAVDDEEPVTVSLPVDIGGEYMRPLSSPAGLPISWPP